MTAAPSERIVLENFAAALREDGYEVVLNPSRIQVPAFLEGETPDAIAFGQPRNLIIEVAAESGPARRRVSRLRQRIAAQSGWELRVVGIASQPSVSSLEVVGAETIGEINKKVKRLSETGETAAALLLGWATFEAIARALLPKDFKRPQTPGRIVEVLAGEGLITPDDADRLRELALKRNDLIHGGLRTDIDQKRLRAFVTTLQSLARRVPRVPEAA